MSAMSATSNTTNPEENKKAAGKLIVAEERSKGKVTAGVYWNYIKAAGGVIVSFTVMLIFILSVGMQAGTSWWLSYWLNQGSGENGIIHGCD
ncbi:hypothetical protein KUTeg_012652 [Tegillarca granosa]|uniref:Uncharacterized protein n=1 Tax=Tegillarca granosa TaxID=220873 RepID=A0ABQ9F3H3_TEGGR|nr:hypothetical protein KUTeg_012652 [Tegillarca granosa]